MESMHSRGASFDRKRRELVDGLYSLDQPVVLLSEEQILIDTPRGEWRENLARLARIAESLEGVDVQVVAVYRDPLETSYSFFVERHYLLKKDFSDYESFVLNSTQARLFDFECFVATMDQLFGRDRYRLFSYEQLCRQEGGLASLVRHLGLEMRPEATSDAEENVKRKGQGFYYSNRINLRTWVASTRPGKWVRSCLPRGLYNWVSLLLEKIPLGRSSLVVFDSERQPELEAVLRAESERTARPKGEAVEYLK